MTYPIFAGVRYRTVQEPYDTDLNHQTGVQGITRYEMEDGVNECFLPGGARCYTIGSDLRFTSSVRRRQGQLTTTVMTTAAAAAIVSSRVHCSVFDGVRLRFTLRPRLM